MREDRAPPKNLASEKKKNTQESGCNIHGFSSTRVQSTITCFSIHQHHSRLEKANIPRWWILYSASPWMCQSYVTSLTPKKKQKITATSEYYQMKQIKYQ
jgi:hypothetical protein